MGVTESKQGLASALEKIEYKHIEEGANAIINAFKKGKKLLIAGNGGSAADAQHFAAELACTFDDRSRKALPAFALTANTSILTAWANDFSFDSVFERQVEAFGNEGDVLVSITTSGNSKNLLSAMALARRKKMANLLLSGKGGGECLKHADLSIVIASSSTPRIQECHIFCIHEMCAMVDKAFKNEK